MKKGQAAMEFLMTYGWALLVVLAAIAALAYFGVLSPQKYLPETCQFPAGFSCLEKAEISDANNRFDFAVRNNNGYRTNLTGVTDDTGADDDCAAPAITACTGVGCTPAALGAGLTFENDQQGIIRITCTSISSGRFKAEVTLNYKSLETGVTHGTTGTITGQAT